jgi:hypothetical protein
MIARLMPKRTQRESPPPPDDAPRESAEVRLERVGVRRAAAVLLLAAGVGLCAWASGADTPMRAALIAGVVAGLVGLGVALIPGTREVVARAMHRVRFPSAKGRAIVAIVLTAGSAYYLLDTANRAGRIFKPIIHDEHVYLIQTRMAAQGRLWMPRHELGDFFDSFHLITDRVYAAKYGPGAAMLCAPAVWLGWPPAMACMLMTAAAAGLLYLVLCRTVDGLAGVLGVVMLLGVSSVRRVSLEVLSQAPMLFLLLLAVWAALNWMEGRRRGWLAVAWAAAGWGVITRPVDGASLCLALAVAMGVMWWRGRPSSRPSPEEAGEGAKAKRGIALDLAVAAVALMPFVVIQLVFDKGVTGRWLEMPWSYWAARNDPYDTISVAPVPPGAPHRPVSAVGRTAAFSEGYTKGKYEAKVAMTPVERLVQRAVKPVLHWGVASPLLLVLVPVSLLGLWGRGRWVVVAVLPLFVWIYSRHTYFIVHYVTSATPALIVMALVGWDALAGLGGRAWGTAVRVGGGLAIGAVAVAALPQLSGDYSADEWGQVAPVFRLIDEQIADGVRPPAVVLFHEDPGKFNANIEPAYNTDVAWPDDAAVIRAHDLGAGRNRELYAYYAELSRRRGEPQRGIYVYNLDPERMGEGPKYLGTAAELAAGK